MVQVKNNHGLAFLVHPTRCEGMNHEAYLPTSTRAHKANVSDLSTKRKDTRILFIYYPASRFTDDLKQSSLNPTWILQLEHFKNPHPNDSNHYLIKLVYLVVCHEYFLKVYFFILKTECKHVRVGRRPKGENLKADFQPNAEPVGFGAPSHDL